MVGRGSERAHQTFTSATRVLKGNVEKLLLADGLLSVVKILNWTKGAFLLFLFGRIAVGFLAVDGLLDLRAQRLEAVRRLL